jgi:hypothetical protein
MVLKIPLNQKPRIRETPISIIVVTLIKQEEREHNVPFEQL